MKFILITYPKLISNEAKIITSLFEGGLLRLHLRKPGIEQFDLRSIIEHIPIEFHDRIVVHHHFNLSNEYKLGGLHFNKGSLSHVKKYTHIKSLSYSAHNFDELLTTDKHMKYSFLSPIYPSTSKENYLPHFTVEDFKLFKEKSVIKQNIIALGGITPNNIVEIQKFGFDGAAILGDFWNSFFSKGLTFAIDYIKQINELCNQGAHT